MEINVGRKIALVVDRKWANAIAAHKLIRMPEIADHPTDMIMGTIDDLESVHGIWIKPSAKHSDFSLASLFIPWGVISAAMLMGADDEKKMGF